MTHGGLVIALLATTSLAAQAQDFRGLDPNDPRGRNEQGRFDDQDQDPDRGDPYDDGTGRQDPIQDPIYDGTLYQDFEQQPQGRRDAGPLRRGPGAEPIPENVRRVDEIFRSDRTLERNDRNTFNPRFRADDFEAIKAQPFGLTLDLSLSTQGQYDTNPLLLSSAEIAGASTRSYGFDAQPALTLRRRSAGTYFEAIGRLSYNEINFLDDAGPSDLDSFDQFGSMEFDAFGPQTRVNVFANASNSTTRTDVLEDTGLVLNDDDVVTYGGGGSVTRAVTSEGELRVSGAVRRREIDTATLSDFTTFEGGVDYKEQVTRSGEAGGGVTYARFMPDLAGTAEVGVITAFATWTQVINERVAFTLEGGPQVIMGDGAGGMPSETDAGVYANAILDVQPTNRDVVTLQAVNAAEASAVGAIRTNTRYRVGYERVLGQNTSLRVPLDVIVQKNTLGDTAARRTLLTAAPEVTHALTQNVGVSGAYRFRRENQAGFSPTTSNGVFVTVKYVGSLIR